MSGKILAVDDDKDILKVIKANLELHDYDVDTAENRGDAQQIISDSKGIGQKS